MRLLFIYLMLLCTLVSWADGSRRNTINSQELAQEDREKIEIANSYKRSDRKPYTVLQNKGAINYIHEGYTKSPYQKKAEAEGKDDYWGRGHSLALFHYSTHGEGQGRPRTTPY